MVEEVIKKSEVQQKDEVLVEIVIERNKVVNQSGQTRADIYTVRIRSISIDTNRIVVNMEDVFAMSGPTHTSTNGQVIQSQWQKVYMEKIQTSDVEDTTQPCHTMKPNLFINKFISDLVK